VSAQHKRTSVSVVGDAQLLRLLFGAYPDALLLVDADGCIAHANPAAAQLLGYAPHELQGLAVDALVPQAVRGRHAAHRQDYASAPRTRPMGLHMELAAQRKDGSQVMVEIALSPLLDHDPPYVVAAIRDVATYPRVRQALQRARYSEHLAQLGRMAVDAREPQSLLAQVARITAEALDADMAVLWLRDGEVGDYRLASAAGLPSGETPGRRASVAETGLEGALPERLAARGLQSMLAVPLSDRGRTIGALAAYSRTVQRFGADEQRFLEALANLLATFVQRAQSEDALKHAQRLESVGQLTGGIAHDFNNLLTIIQGNLQVLKELPSLADDAPGRKMVAAAVRAAQRGAELTGKLLAFSRRQVLQPSAIDVGQMLHSLADMLRRTLDQRIRIEVDVEQACPPVLADAGQLESALLNIAINARDAMHGGGTLRFSARSSTVLPAELRDGLDDADSLDAPHVAIGVSDTGSGMSDAVRRRAFEPFFTTKDAGRGTGLGLSTVYGFVRQSRGAVALDSAPGSGTTLTLFLPRARMAAAEAQAGSAEFAPALPAGLKVLLVEDDAEVREVVHGFLQVLQCQVTQAASGEQALLALGPHADFDLLLSDIALGAGMRGTRLAALAQQQLPRLAVLLMSGYSAELLDADRDAPAGWELLRKPYSPAELSAAMARLMAGR